MTLAKFERLIAASGMKEEFRRYYATKKLPLVTRIPLVREFLVSAVAAILRKQPGFLSPASHPERTAAH
jgi:hypothetical protein